MILLLDIRPTSWDDDFKKLYTYIYIYLTNKEFEPKKQNVICGMNKRVFPKIEVPPKWMVYIWFIMEILLKWMIWGENTYFWKHPYESNHLAKYRK